MTTTVELELHPGTDSPLEKYVAQGIVKFMDAPVIPDYILETCCGSGAYGDVWTAKDRSGISRAVKLLDKGRLERLGVLHREEKAIELFRTNVPRHPSLVEIHHVGENDKYIYYVMDLADNLGAPGKYVADTLDERLKKIPLAIPDAKKLMESMLDAIECLHAAGLVHRDIKPSNIIFTGGNPRLADIGLVRSITTTVSIAGTPGFMVPEGSVGPESDLYALGKLLYCVITGRQVDAFPSLPDFPDSADLAEIKLMNIVILRACDKEPKNRFRSVIEFRNALHGRISRRIRARTVTALAVLFVLAVVALLFTIDSAVKNSRMSGLIDEARSKMQAGDIRGAFVNIASIMKIDPDNKDAGELMKELIKQKSMEKKRKMSLLLDEVRAKRQAGDILGAIKDTGSIIEIDPDNMEAKSLRSELIKQEISEKFKSPAKYDKEEHPLTPGERKEFAMLLLLYNTFMTKGNYAKAIDALDSVEKKWPYMKQRDYMQNLRRQTQEKLSGAKSAAGGG